MEKQKLPHSTTVLVLGIVSILASCCCTVIIGAIPAIIGLVLAKKGTDLYNSNPDLYEGYNNLKTGKILNIIGIALGVLMMLYTIYNIQQMGGWDAYVETIREAIEQAQQQ
jgi:uncharacterized membrane protein